MGIFYSKPSVPKSELENALSTIKFSKCKALGQQINNWRDNCVELIKTYFVKLLPLTDAIGKFLCEAVIYTETIFNVVASMINVMSVSFSPEIDVSPKTYLNLASLLTNFISNGLLRTKYLTLMKLHENVLLQLPEDNPNRQIFTDGVMLFLKFWKVLVDWIGKRVEQENKLLRKFREGLTEKNLDNKLPKCRCEQPLGKMIKGLAITVGQFKMEMEEIMWNYRDFAVSYYYKL